MSEIATAKIGQEPIVETEIERIARLRVSVRNLKQSMTTMDARDKPGYETLVKTWEAEINAYDEKVAAEAEANKVPTVLEDKSKSTGDQPPKGDPEEPSLSAIKTADLCKEVGHRIVNKIRKTYGI